MARPLRIKYEGAVYHITARGNERKRIFFAASDYTKFKEFLREAQEKGVRSALDSSKKGGFNLYNLINEKASNLLLIHKKVRSQHPANRKIIRMEDWKRELIPFT